MARFRVGPVRVGGGRRASFTANAGPFGVTVGGRRRRRGGSGGGPSYWTGPDGPSAAEERQQQREMEKEERRYREWYATLTPSEQLFEDRRKWEDWEGAWAGNDDDGVIGGLKVGLVSYLIVQFFLVLWLVGGSIFSCFFVFLLAYGLNRWVVSNIPAVSTLKSMLLNLDPRDYWLKWSLYFALAIFLMFVGPISGSIGVMNLIATIWHAWRWGNLRSLAKRIEISRNVFEEMKTNGVINDSNLNQVWFGINKFLIVQKCFQQGKYFQMGVFFPSRSINPNKPSVLMQYPAPVIKFGSTNPKSRRRKPPTKNEE